MSESITCPVCNATSYNRHDVEHGWCGRCRAYTRDRAFLLPPEPRSWDVLNGRCGWGVAEDVRCGKPVDHDPPHRAHDPSGSGDWIEFDDDGKVTDRGRWQPEPLRLSTPQYDGPEDRDRRTLAPFVIILAVVAIAFPFVAAALR